MDEVSTEKKPPPAQPSREERLAAALRENLRKRKLQERARDDGTDGDPAS